MKVQMLETYQGVGHTAVLLDEGTRVSILEKGESYEVDLTLGSWLVDNRKAEEIESQPIHYGAQSEPQFRHDDELYKEMTAESQAEEPPADEKMMSTKNQATTAPKRTRKK